MKNALVISCSTRKLSAPLFTPAINVYDGNMFRIVKKHMPDVDLFIFSAQYGLIPANYRIMDYDKKMSDLSHTDKVVEAGVMSQQICAPPYNWHDREKWTVLMGWDYLRWLLVTLDKATEHRNFGDKYMSRLKILGLESRGSGEMQTELKHFCLQNQLIVGERPPEWHQCVS